MCLAAGYAQRPEERELGLTDGEGAQGHTIPALGSVSCSCARRIRKRAEVATAGTHTLAVFHESLLILRALQGWSSSPRGNRGPERLSSLPEVAQPGRGPRGDGPDSALHVQLGPCRQSRPRAWEPTLPGAPSRSRASSLDKGQRPHSPPCAASATARQGARGAGELRALRAGGWPWRRARHLSPFRPQTW